MTIETFNYKYREKGGYVQFYKMLMEDNCTQKQIAEHFAVSKTSVKLWKTNMLPSADPRLERRSRKIDVIIAYLETHSEYETKRIFRHTNKGYLREALFLSSRKKTIK